MAVQKQSLEQWATDLLLHAHAIAACPGCGFMKLKMNPKGLDYAHSLAEHDPYPRKNKLECVAAVDAVYDSLGDDCQGC